MNKRELEKLDDRELVALLHEQDKVIEAAREEKRRIARVRDAKLSDQAERDRLLAAGMSEDRVDAIARAGLLVAGGVAQSTNGE